MYVGSRREQWLKANGGSVAQISLYTVPLRVRITNCSSIQICSMTGFCSINREIKSLSHVGIRLSKYSTRLFFSESLFPAWPYAYEITFITKTRILILICFCFDINNTWTMCNINNILFLNQPSVSLFLYRSCLSRRRGPWLVK